MRKKWLTAGAAFGIGAVMLVVSGVSAMANTSGYDAYKAAMNNTKTAQSVTANVDMTVTDNGTKVLAGTADIKLNKPSNTGSIAATFGDGSQTHSTNVYRQDGNVIIKSSEDEIYRVMKQNDPEWQHDGAMPNPPKAVEQLFDALTGNIKELATVESEPDGGKQASLHLSGSQIPAVVNALGSLAVSKADEHHNGSFTSPDKKVNLPELTDNIKVEKINLDASISPDNLLEQQTAEINISGTDDSGKAHVLVIRLHVDFSGINETTPERIDLTGKQTVEIQNDGTKRGWHH
ncbi:hypothetical protein [Paenibacillus beijingensis]|uniref:Uncharacterized protein n=1 Tax=Paenibacillus beijingensis TaxID=1126833 RepID=A0A0D5NEY1_9BACL|nr:hypothetical protein [Paenibacillus beijingensis]AJY73537.1 hypothetical protein VN24_01465 [Paenibacillus beijingensis]